MEGNSRVVPGKSVHHGSPSFRHSHDRLRSRPEASAIGFFAAGNFNDEHETVLYHKWCLGTGTHMKKYGRDRRAKVESMSLRALSPTGPVSPIIGD